MTAKVIPIGREAALRQTLHAYSSGDYRQPLASKRRPKPQPIVSQWFVSGPFPGEQYVIAARLPGQALLVWQMVHHQRRLGGREEVALPAVLLTRMGVGPDARVDALHHLEAARLITVTWLKGRSPRIRLID